MWDITKKEIKEYLESVLNMSEPITIAIKGKWGIGKTCFIKEFLQNKFEGKYVYVSLFGKSNIDEVIQEIVLSLYSRNRFTSKLKEILGLTGGAAYYKTEVKGVSLNLTTSLITSILSLAEKQDFKGIVIVIDDLERTKIDIEQILGIINQLKEEKDCKVILIFNEEKITGKDEDEKENKYKEYKEKCIDTEVLFNPSLDENFSLLDEIIKTRQGENFQQEKIFIFEIIKSYFREIEGRGYSERNLRIFLYIFNKLRDVSFIQKLDIDDYLKESIFKTLTFLFYIKKKPSVAATSKEELKEYLNKQKSAEIKIFQELANRKNQESQKENSKETDDFIKPEDSILHLENEKFFSELLKFWEYEIMTQELQDSISKELKSYQKKIKDEKNLREKSKFINNIYERYLLDLNYSKENFIKDTWKFLEENKALLLKITDIWNILPLLKKLIEFDLKNKDRYLNFAKELFRYYLVDKFESNKEFLFDTYSGAYEIIEYLSKLGIDKSYLEEDFKLIKEKYKYAFQVLDCERIFEYLKGIIRKNGWSNFELELANSLEKERLKECFEQTGDLSFISDFFRKNSSFFKNLKNVLINTLDEFEKEEKYEEKIKELKRVIGLIENDSL